VRRLLIPLLSLSALVSTVSGMATGTASAAKVPGTCTVSHTYHSPDNYDVLITTGHCSVPEAYFKQMIWIDNVIIGNPSFHLVFSRTNSSNWKFVGSGPRKGDFTNTASPFTMPKLPIDSYWTFDFRDIVPAGISHGSMVIPVSGMVDKPISCRASAKLCPSLT
jgi:hypothetical protein